MATTRFQQSIPSLHNGISKQSPSIRFPNQVEDAKNVLFSIVDGAIKRPGSRHHSSFNVSKGDPLYKIHKIERDDEEEYLVIYGSEGANFPIRIAQVNNARNRTQYVTLTVTAGAGGFRMIFDGITTGNIDTSGSGIATALNIFNRLDAIPQLSGRVNATYISGNIYQVVINDEVECQDLFTFISFTGTCTAAESIGTYCKIVMGTGTQDYLNYGNPTAKNIRMLTVTDTTVICNTLKATGTLASVATQGNTALDPDKMPIKLVRTSVAPPTFTASKITWNTAPDATLTQKINVAKTSGTFILVFQGQSTSALAWNVTASDMRNALAALSTLNIDNLEIIKVDTTYSVFLTPTATFPFTTGAGLITCSDFPTEVISSTVDFQSVAPTPFKSGSVITDIVYHRGRIGFAMGEWTVFSQPDDLYNFFPESNDVVNDADPITLQIGADTVSKINHMIPFRKGLLIITQGGRQFDLGAGDTFTASTASFTPSTQYAAQNVKPATTGTKIYFPGMRENTTPIWEYTYDDVVLTNTATDITSHVQNLIPQEIRTITASDNNNTVLIVPNYMAQSQLQPYESSAIASKSASWSNPASWNLGIVPSPESNVTILDGHTIVFDHYESDSSTIFVYRQYYSGSERIQSAWSVYEFADDDIHDICIVDDTAFMIRLNSFATTSSIIIEALPLTANPTPPPGFDYQPRLDHRHVIVGLETENLDIVGQPYWTMPAFDPTINTAVSMNEQTSQWEVITVTNTSDPATGITTLIKEDLDNTYSDWATRTVVLGRLIDFDISLSQVFSRDAKGDAVIDAKVELAKLVVNHREAGDYSVSVASSARADRVSNFYPENDVTVEETGKFTAWITGRSTDAGVSIKSTSAKPLAITSVEYHGKQTILGVE